MSEDFKRTAALRAVEFVEPGMKLGLGTGSTADRFLEVLAERKLDVIGVPTSEVTRRNAERLGLRLTTLDAEPRLDLVIDGADEIDGELRLIKGAGGAHLREKIVAMAGDRMIVIADHTKKVRRLGKSPLPIEVVEFGLRSTENLITAMAEEAGCRGPVSLRKGKDGKPFRTDSGNLILDCAFGEIADPELLAGALELVPGVVEHGLFIGIADLAVIAGPAGIEELTSPEDDFDDAND
ncbi:MAG: ribose-5-phosphate isomerase RpiA [Hyphomicrobiaceae bacterium]|nr:MAG: ribose-5-phosphate isomerase RpiA [Hyphomicrobiaceae bacterium]